MKTKTITLYEYDELPTERAKERARDWFREVTAGDCYEWEGVQEDAEMIGLVLESLDQHRPNKGHFKAGALETALKIEEEHGESCETFKTTKAFLDKRGGIVNDAPRDENGDFSEEGELDDKLDELESEYLHDLLEDYRIMLDRNIEDANSTEVVENNIRANEYTFREDGKRED
jgi:hypothetical protein